jgi:micrococcal nuclease
MKTTVRRMTLSTVLGSLFVFVSACSTADSLVEPTGVQPAQTLPFVTRVIDGDTLVVEGVGTVRLIGVDTPETVDPRRPVQYFGREASDFTRQLATGKPVRLEFDRDRTDRYGRTLAYVYLQPEDLLLNAEIIRLGYGFAYTVFPFRMMDLFRTLEREAREAGRGLWATQSSAGHGELPLEIFFKELELTAFARGAARGLRLAQLDAPDLS